MIKVIEYSESYKSRWDAFVKASPVSTIAHEIGWREVMTHGLGHKPMYLVAMEDDEVLGVLPLMLVTTWWRARYLVSLPWIDYGGVCAADSEAAGMLLKKAGLLADKSGVEFIELRSVTAELDGLPVRQDKVTFLLELNDDPDIVWKKFGAKLRNQIRKAKKSGLTTNVGGLENLPAFYRVFSHNMRDLGTPVWGYRFFESILSIFPETAKIILVSKDKLVIAGGLALYFKDRLYVPSASAYRGYLKYCPNHALYWRLIEDGCRGGYRYFDLKIDEDFLVEVKTGWPKPFEYCCACFPLTSGYKGIYGVEIKINYEHSLVEAIFHLLHEMWHAKQYYKNKSLSLEKIKNQSSFFEELRADFYALRKFGKYYKLAKRLSGEAGI